MACAGFVALSQCDAFFSREKSEGSGNVECRHVAGLMLLDSSIYRRRSGTGGSKRLPSLVVDAGFSVVAVCHYPGGVLQL